MSASQFVHVAVLADVDPFSIVSDAAAQVIEHQLRLRLDPHPVIVTFHTIVRSGDPRRRTPWTTAAIGSAWQSNAHVILDSLPPGSDPFPAGDTPLLRVDFSSAAMLFPEHVDAAALETRRLMLIHLDITSPDDQPRLTATDHLALGVFPAGAPEKAERDALLADFDRAAALIREHSGQPTQNLSGLLAEVERLRAELDHLRSEAAAREQIAASELDARARRIRELTEQVASAHLGQRIT